MTAFRASADAVSGSAATGGPVRGASTSPAGMLDASGAGGMLSTGTVPGGSGSSSWEVSAVAPRIGGGCASGRIDCWRVRHGSRGRHTAASAAFSAWHSGHGDMTCSRRAESDRRRLADTPYVNSAGNAKRPGRPRPGRSGDVTSARVVACHEAASPAGRRKPRLCHTLIGSMPAPAIVRKNTLVATMVAAMPLREAVGVQADAELVGAEPAPGVTMLPKTASTAMPRSLTMPPQRACRIRAFQMTISTAPFSFGSQPQNRPHDWSAQMPPSTVPTKLSSMAKQTTP